MSRMSKQKLTADEIAEKASREEDISSYFTNQFKVVWAVQRVNVDLTQSMLREPDARLSEIAKDKVELNTRR